MKECAFSLKTTDVNKLSGYDTRKKSWKANSLHSICSTQRILLKPASLIFSVVGRRGFKLGHLLAQIIQTYIYKMSFWPVAAASSIALKLDTRKRNCSNLEQTVHCKPIQILIQTSWFMKLCKKIFYSSPDFLFSVSMMLCHRTIKVSCEVHDTKLDFCDGVRKQLFKKKNYLKIFRAKFLT